MNKLLLMVVVFLSCSIDMDKHVVRLKTDLGNGYATDSENRMCKYKVWGTMPWCKFYADSGLYYVGDSLNKWHRLAQKLSKESADTLISEDLY